MFHSFASVDGEKLGKLRIDLMNFFLSGQLCTFSQYQMADERVGTCYRCNKKKIENKHKYNMSRSVYLLQDANVIEINTMWFPNFRRFALSRVNFSHGNQELV